LLELYGIDPDTYGNNPNVQIQTTFNTDKMIVRGLELDYTQQLLFLPDWARGMSIFANAT
jgi:outer membrane receptor protein involved in Fe transport